MSEHHLIFHQVFAHRFPLVPGQTTYTIFEDSGRGTDESITRLTEQEIVEWIFKDRLTRGHFLRTIIPGATEFCHFLCVQKPVIEYSQKPGDIDILMWPKGRPDLAIAIECKRAKVVVEPNGKEKVNRLSEIDKGIRQVNELRELGFHKRYLMILILTDGRNKTTNNAFFRYADSETIKEIYNIPWRSELHSDVGVIYVQISQPTSVKFQEMHGFGVCVDKSAKELEQPKELTAKIRMLNG